MNTIIAALREKVFVKLDTAAAIGIKFNHPTADTVGIELLIPCRIK